MLDLHRDDVDMAVRRGRGSWPGTRTARLMDAVAVPLCDPALLDGDNPLRETANGQSAKRPDALRMAVSR